MAIVESRWWDNGNDSVRPLFETLAGIVEENPHAVRYDMFAEEKSLRCIIADISSNAALHSLYIAAHGNDGSVFGLGNCEISRTVLRNMMRDANTNKTICGIYFGSCLVANKENALFWLKSTPPTHLQWIAGYENSVDWIDSSAVDMIFWSKYLHERKLNRSRKKNKKTEISMVKHAASEMKKLMPTVFSEMGFNLYYLDTGGSLESVW